MAERNLQFISCKEPPGTSMLSVAKAQCVWAGGNKLRSLLSLLANAEKAVTVKPLRVGVDGLVPGLVS